MGALALRRLVASVVCIASCCLPAAAAEYTWTGLTDALWTNAGNWDPNTGSPSAADTTVFNGAGNVNTTISLGTGQSTLGILFTSSNAAAYTIGSGAVNAQTLTLAATGTIAVDATVVTNQLFNAAVRLGDASSGTFTFRNDDLDNLLTFSGLVAGGTGGTAGAQTLVVAGAGSTTIAGAISNGGATSLGLTKSGAGTLALSGANTFTGDLTINNGTLIASNSGNTQGFWGSLGNVQVARNITVSQSGTLTFTAGNVTGNSLWTPLATLTVNAGGVVNSGVSAYNSLGLVTLSGGTINTLGGFNAENGGFGLLGDITVLSSSTTTSTLASPSGGASSVFTMLRAGGVTFNVGDGAAATDLLVAGVLGGAVGLTKSGLGTMRMSGSNTYTGNTVVSAGVLNVASGGAINTGGGSVTVADGAANASLTIDGGSVTSATPMSIGGGAATGAGVATINSGRLTAGGEIWVGSNSGSAGSGALIINSGTVTTSSWLALGRGSAAGSANTRGLLVQTGGQLNVGGGSGGNLSIGAFQLSGTATSVMAISGGTTSVTNNVFVGENLSGILDLAGGLVQTGTTQSVRLRQANTINSIGYLNLRGGTVATGAVGTAGAAGTSIFNFNGGTLRALQPNATFMQGLTQANVFAGGAVIDTNGNAITIGQVLLAASGTGVNSIAVTGGSGYVAPPIVEITGGGGTGATALATIDASGNLTGITVTNPGTGYTSDPTITLFGGGGSGASIGSIGLAANTSGGLAKVGLGTLTLTGINTFSGNITIDSGTLAAGTTVTGNPTASNLGALAPASARTITVNNGATLSLTGGDVLGDGGSVNTLANVALVVNQGGVFRTGLDGAGAGWWNKIGATTLTGGTIRVGSGANSTTFQGLALIGTVTASGSIASSIENFAGSDATTNGIHLGQNAATGQSITFNVADVTNDTNADLTISARLLNTSQNLVASGLTKTGAGTLLLTASNSYTGPTTVTAGMLSVGSGGAINAGGGIVTVADAASNALLLIADGTVTSAGPMLIGGAAGIGTGVVTVNSGRLTASGELRIGTNSTTASYAALLINGGTVSTASWLALGRGSAAGSANTRGLLMQTRGQLNVGGGSGGNLSIGAFQLSGTATSVMAISGGTTSVTNNVYVGENLSGILDVSGGLVQTGTTQSVRLRHFNTANSIGYLNLSGGTVATGAVGTAGAAGTSIFNFNGGTLQALQPNATFMQGLTQANVFAGGAVIDTNGNAITVGQALLAASGTGVNSIAVTGGAGYVAPPLVEITGGGGTGATALATIDASGNLTGLTVTNPGTGYTSNPTISLFGGGGSGASIGSIGLAANTSGGLTKVGLGTLTLTASNSFTGATRIAGGTLALGSGASLASTFIKAGDAALDGGTLDVSALAGGLQLASGQTLGGHGTILGDVTIGAGAIVAPGGSIGNLSQQGTQTWAGGGEYAFEVFNAGGAAGTGYDLLTVDALVITATTGNPFTVSIASLENALDNTPGTLQQGNWDPNANYQWKFLVATTTTFSSSNFDPSWFTLDASSFNALNTVNGSFSIARGGESGLGGSTQGNELYIVYAAVPEPGTLALAGIGMAGVVLTLRRRRRGKLAT